MSRLTRLVGLTRLGSRESTRLPIVVSARLRHLIQAKVESKAGPAEEAVKHGAALILGDRPIEITTPRAARNVPYYTMLARGISMVGKQIPEFPTIKITKPVDIESVRKEYLRQTKPVDIESLRKEYLRTVYGSSYFYILPPAIGINKNRDKLLSMSELKQIRRRRLYSMALALCLCVGFATAIGKAIYLLCK